MKTSLWEAEPIIQIKMQSKTQIKKERITHTNTWLTKSKKKRNNDWKKRFEKQK